MFLFIVEIGNEQFLKIKVILEENYRPNTIIFKFRGEYILDLLIKC